MITTATIKRKQNELELQGLEKTCQRISKTSVSLASSGKETSNVIPFICIVYISRVIVYYAWVIFIYILCFMLVYSIYCTVVSLLLLSPSIEPCICKYLPPPRPRLVHKLFAGGKVMEVVIYFISNNLLLISLHHESCFRY